MVNYKRYRNLESTRQNHESTLGKIEEIEQLVGFRTG